ILGKRHRYVLLPWRERSYRRWRLFHRRAQPDQNSRSWDWKRIDFTLWFGGLHGRRPRRLSLQRYVRSDRLGDGPGKPELVVPQHCLQPWGRLGFGHLERGKAIGARGSCLVGPWRHKLLRLDTESMTLSSLFAIQ